MQTLTKQKRGWHRKGKTSAISRCGTCFFHKLDENWERIGAPFELRRICTNKNSYQYEMHLMAEESCPKHEKRNKP